jgi:hypothetical protein
VKLTLVARDEAEQEGRSDTDRLHAAAAAVHEAARPRPRRAAAHPVLDPTTGGACRPRSTRCSSRRTGSRRNGASSSACGRLRAPARRKGDADLLEVADWLWAMALQIEDGGLSDAERELRAAQERLREALDRGANDEEIKRLTDELRQAMDRFLREFAERMQRDSSRGRGPERQRRPHHHAGRPQPHAEPDRGAMMRGDVAEAQRLLDQLRNILENLQTARPSNRMTIRSPAR